jgi:hypothetical protein
MSETDKPPLTVILETLATMQQAITSLETAREPPVESARWQWGMWAWGGGIAVCTAVLLGAGVLWFMPRQPPQNPRLFYDVDRVLYETWGTLPKATQERLEGAYIHYRVPSPGERRPKRQAAQKGQ